MVEPSDKDISHRTLFCTNLVDKSSIVDKAILDIGSSESYWMSNYFVKNGAKNVVAVDPTIDKEIENGKIVSYKGDVFLDKLNGQKFDIAVMFDVIEHIPKNTEEKTLIRISSLIKQGGSFYLTTPHDHWLMNLTDPAWYLGHRHYNHAWMKSLLEEAGFEVVKSGVTGGIWENLRVLWLYVQKHLFRKTTFSYPIWLWDWSNAEFKKNGIMTNWFVLRKR